MDNLNTAAAVLHLRSAARLIENMHPQTCMTLLRLAKALCDENSGCEKSISEIEGFISETNEARG